MKQVSVRYGRQCTLPPSKDEAEYNREWCDLVRQDGGFTLSAPGRPDQFISAGAVATDEEILALSRPKGSGPR